MDIKDIYINKWMSPTVNYSNFIDSYKSNVKKDPFLDPNDVHGGERDTKVTIVDSLTPAPTEKKPKKEGLSGILKKFSKSKKVKKEEDEFDKEVISSVIDFGTEVVGKLLDKATNGAVSDALNSFDDSSNTSPTVTPTDTSTSNSKILLPGDAIVTNPNIVNTSELFPSVEDLTVDSAMYEKVCKKITKKILQLGERIVDEDNFVFNTLMNSSKYISFGSDPVRPGSHVGPGVLIEDSKMYLVQVYNGTIDKVDKPVVFAELVKQKRYDSLIKELKENGGVISLIFDNENTLNDYNEKTLLNKKLTFVGTK